MPFEEGLKASAETSKPLMLVIHKSWCGACKALKPNFAKDKGIAELGTKFIMVNVEDDEEPGDQKYAPDGGYIPRILFLNSKGDVQQDLINENGNANYKYYYPQTADIVLSMKKALETIKPAPPPKPDEL
ncbi:thioredoxin domain-containing protein 12 [Lingula anatina]|uniref:Thioredoxin domain-containing protein 12 n=1 Tax=Lingula anatina TaxID=7574 RepID=A0A1S3H6C1_LINAN|nr:thioredoxin domain-containing protein 12 [Lingula anatina]|eukprot:XP_013380674.1 thioredoxin domain-containing protein 12 [Lingula anatina]